MKKIILLSFAFIFADMFGFAQKFAYVDTKYILEHIPEYRAAQEKLDQYSIQWQAEIEKKYEEIDKLYKGFQAEQILLTEEMKKKREQEIIQKEREVKEFQKQKFGYQGELFKKRQELIKPTQDRVYDAVQTLAKEKTYAFIFDKSSDVVMIYTNSKYDESDKIIIALGYTPGETGKQEKDKQGNSTLEKTPANGKVPSKETDPILKRE